MDILVCSIALTVLISLRPITQSHTIKKFEKEKLNYLLEDLYEDPNLRWKHQLFMINLKKLDRLVDTLKNDGYIYTPNPILFEKLAKHLNRYPVDDWGYDRLIHLVKLAQNSNSEIFVGHKVSI